MHDAVRGGVDDSTKIKKVLYRLVVRHGAPAVTAALDELKTTCIEAPRGPSATIHPRGPENSR